MVPARSLVSVPVLAILLSVGPGSRAEERPRLVPSRDVDVRYDVTRPQQPRVRERVRWLAGEGLERVDSSGRSTSIFERDAHAVTLLTPATRTFRKLDHVPRRPVEPEPGAVLARGADATVAGLSCTDWSWIEDGEKHRLRHRRRGHPAFDCRRTNLHRGALGQVRPAESRPIPGTRELHARACS